jgi:hypothetical protein
MSARSHTVPLDLAKVGFPTAKIQVLAASSPQQATRLSKRVAMEPFSVVIAKVTK